MSPAPMVGKRVVSARVAIASEEPEVIGLFEELLFAFPDCGPPFHFRDEIRKGEGERYTLLRDGAPVAEASREELYCRRYGSLGARQFCQFLEREVAFHAACVLPGEEAILLMGEGGAGKTTMAIEFASCGRPVFSDEISVLDLASGEVRPALFPIRHESPPSRPEAWRLSPGSWEEGQPVLLGRPVGVGEGFCRQRAKLGRIVCLEYRSGAKARIERLSAGMAALRLYQHSHLRVLDPERALAECVGIARRIPAYQLTSGEKSGSRESIASLASG